MQKKFNQNLLRKIAEVFGCLSPNQKKQLVRLQIIFIFSAFLELAAVASIGPFMSAVAGPDSGMISTLKENLSGIFIGLETIEILLLLGVTVLALLLTSSIVSIYAIWRLSLYSEEVGAEICSRLFKYYMLRGSEAHNSANSSIMVSNIVQETARLRDLVIQPFMNMLAKIAVAFVIFGALIIYDPAVGIAGVALFMFAYIVLYKIIKKGLYKSGDQISKMNGQVIKNMNEAFGAYRELQLAGQTHKVIWKFGTKMQLLGSLRGNIAAVAQLPRYLMELIAFGSLISLSVYLIWVSKGAPSEIVATLAIYALAGFKILPAVQNIYGSLVQIQANISAFDTLREDLAKSIVEQPFACLPAHEKGQEPLILDKSFGFQNVSYKYPNSSNVMLSEISLEIFVGQSVGIVGPSGAGKSTALDLLLGLIDPTSGTLMVDGSPLQKKSMQSWYQKIGFVPQFVYLSDKSIRENIALGVEPNSIDDEQVMKVIELVELTDIISELDQGIFTLVGERGARFSGGQRQRIGLARALYREAPILVLDEATSGLDNVTERLIMNKIHALGGNKTLVIIAHRLSTIKACDIIFYLDNGRILDKGSYSDLLESNSEFRNMAYIVK